MKSFELGKCENMNLFEVDWSQFNINKEFINQVSKTAIYNHLKYKQNFYVSKYINKYKIELFKLLFFTIINNELYVVCNEIEVVCFNTHFQSFEIGKLCRKQILHKMSYFTSCPLHIHNLNNAKVYLRNKIM